MLFTLRLAAAPSLLYHILLLYLLHSRLTVWANPIGDRAEDAGPGLAQPQIPDQPPHVLLPRAPTSHEGRVAEGSRWIAELSRKDGQFKPSQVKTRQQLEASGWKVSDVKPGKLGRKLFFAPLDVMRPALEHFKLSTDANEYKCTEAVLNNDKEQGKVVILWNAVQGTIIFVSTLTPHSTLGKDKSPAVSFSSDIAFVQWKEDIAAAANVPLTNVNRIIQYRITNDATKDTIERALKDASAPPIEQIPGKDPYLFQSSSAGAAGLLRSPNGLVGYQLFSTHRTDLGVKGLDKIYVWSVKGADSATLYMMEEFKSL